ncbi:HAD hydrolase family protein [Niabella sp. W65]|nr:HAD hydrolase family protein [Niabella sp. W65]MCH7365562.1 HAD hydrolase family protein [Niabella sp. W65]ULT41342.1 HAD hydrolase family protein [Niabella sp. I65]
MRSQEAMTGKWIPPKAIHHHVDALEKLKTQFDLSVRNRRRLQHMVKEQEAHLPKAVICDLDGTLALMDDRDPFDASGCENDRLNQAVANTLNFYHQNGYQILLVSGREDKYREPTLRFLEKHAIPFNGLWMRPRGNYIKDSVLKKSCLNRRSQAGIMYRLYG